MWAPAIKALRQPAGGDPKKRAAWHVYMSKHAVRIAEIFTVERELPENKEKAGIALRTEIAKRLLAEAGEDDLREIDNEIKADYEAKVAEQEHLRTAEPSDPALQRKYVSNVAVISLC